MSKLKSYQKDWLYSLVVDGYKLCHTAECSNYTVCPKRCGCNKHLDLYTAIAWTVAERLNNILNDKHLTLTKLKSLADSINFALSVVRLHKYDHYELYILLELARIDISYIITNLRKNKKKATQ